MLPALHGLPSRACGGTSTSYGTSQPSSAWRAAPRRSRPTSRAQASPKRASAPLAATAPPPAPPSEVQQQASNGSSSNASASHARAASPAAPLVLVQKTHSLHARGFEVIQELGPWADTSLMRYLKPVHSCWQPQDLLPDPASPDFHDQVRAHCARAHTHACRPHSSGGHGAPRARLAAPRRWQRVVELAVDSTLEARALSGAACAARGPQVLELRKGAQQLPNDYLVVLVGDMVTEEALPSYMNMLNTLDSTKARGEHAGSARGPCAQRTSSAHVISIRCCCKGRAPHWRACALRALAAHVPMRPCVACAPSMPPSPTPHSQRATQCSLCRTTPQHESCCMRHAT